MNNDKGCSSKAQAIAWRDGKKKEAVVDCLNSPEMLNQMPEEIRGNTGEMVVWAVKRLSEIFHEDALKKDAPVTLGSIRFSDAKTHYEHHQVLRSIISEVFGVEPTKSRIQMDYFEVTPKSPDDKISFWYMVDVPIENFRGDLINELLKRIGIGIDDLNFYPQEGHISFGWQFDEYVIKL